MITEHVVYLINSFLADTEHYPKKDLFINDRHQSSFNQQFKRFKKSKSEFMQAQGVKESRIHLYLLIYPLYWQTL